jgi:hypothetical protein
LLAMATAERSSRSARTRNRSSAPRRSSPYCRAHPDTEEVLCRRRWPEAPAVPLLALASPTDRTRSSRGHSRRSRRSTRSVYASRPRIRQRPAARLPTTTLPSRGCPYPSSLEEPWVSPGTTSPARNSSSTPSLASSARPEASLGALVASAQALWLLHADDSAVRRERGLTLAQEWYQRRIRYQRDLTPALSDADQQRSRAQLGMLEQDLAAVKAARISRADLNVTDIIRVAADVRFDDASLLVSSFTRNAHNPFRPLNDQRLTRAQSMFSRFDGSSPTTRKTSPSTSSVPFQPPKTTPGRGTLTLAFIRPTYRRRTAVAPWESCARSSACPRGSAWPARSISARP